MPMCSGKEGMEPQSSWYKSYLGANPTHCMLWVPRRPPRETQVWTWELWVCHGAGASPVWPEWEFPAGRVGAELGRASELVGGGFHVTPGVARKGSPSMWLAGSPVCHCQSQDRGWKTRMKKKCVSLKLHTGDILWQLRTIPSPFNKNNGKSQKMCCGPTLAPCDLKQVPYLCYKSVSLPMRGS